MKLLGRFLAGFLPGNFISGCCGTNTKLSPPLQHHFSAVIHLAGLKAVGESVQKPLEYYRVNLTGTIRLLEVSGAGRNVWCWGTGLGVILLGGAELDGAELAGSAAAGPCSPDHESPRREEHCVQQFCHRLRRPQVPAPG